MGQGSAGPGARTSGKPILLSIGYSACHWCHVMAHESFEDAATARAHERAVREHQGGSRRAAGHRPHLPVRAPGAHAARRRLAAHDVPDARRSAAVLRRHVFPRQGALRHAGLHDLLERVARVLPRAARGAARAERRADGRVQRSRRPRRADAASRSRAAPLDGARAAARSQPSTSSYGGFGGAPKFPHPGIDRAPAAPLACDARRRRRPTCRRCTWPR